MSKTGWIVLLVAGTCAGVVIGATLGKGKGPEITRPQPSERTEEKRRESDRVQVLLASLEKYRKALAEREKEIGQLQAELAEVSEKLPPPLSPEEEKKRKEEEERRKRNELRKARQEKSKELRTKILQRKDKLLRALALEELAGLLQSDDAEETLLGLTTLQRLYGINFDKERFKPYVLTALNHEDAEVRSAGLNCLYTVSAREEVLDMVLPMAKDPAPEVRRWVAGRIGWMGMEDRKDEVASVLRELLQDEDNTVKRQAFDALSRRREVAEEMEDLAIEMSREEERADDMLQWLGRRDTISGKVAQRLAEMYDEGRTGYYGLEWVRRRLSEDAKPIAIDFCLEVIRDSIEHFERSRAMDALRRIGDVSVLVDLEEISRSDDAEGIEDQLARTMEYLQKRSREAR